jgi:hypothetical protein
MKALPLVNVAALALLSGCVSVPITPANVAKAPVPAQVGRETMDRWNEAVHWCNEFLASSNRVTLPPGELRMNERGMEFVSRDRIQPVRVRCTRFGDLTVWCGFDAQERSDGFVVGRVKPKRSRVLDNSFFKSRNGTPSSSLTMASLTLHELTHSWCRVGTVSFRKSVAYYAECVFLFRYSNHSMERLANKTSGEFANFVMCSGGIHAN